MTRKKKPAPQGIVCGFAWFRAEQWPQLLSASVDRKMLEATHAEWLEQAQRTLIDLATRGVRVEKVDVSVAELVQWCRENRRPLDSAARADYAAFKLLQSPGKS